MNGPRFLLFGKSGQVGRALQPHLAMLGKVLAYDRRGCDIGDLVQLRSVIRKASPDFIVNAAAYTSVDRAESDEQACTRINAIAPGIIAEEADRIGACLIHYSTDYVFDGRKAEAYVENDEPCPLNAYGRSKLAGDCAVMAVSRRHVVLRVGWVYGISSRNFAQMILRLAAERDELRIVADQFGAPTSSRLIADVTAQIIRRNMIHHAASEVGGGAGGIFNLAPQGRVSRHGYAVELVREARRQGARLRASENAVIPVRSETSLNAAMRPANSSLNTDKIRRLLCIALPEWQPDVRRFVAHWQRSAS